jgi:gas vesicle protein
MKFLFGFLIGFAAGAAAALLYAPATGEEMRAKLSSQAPADWAGAQAQVHRGIETIQGQLAGLQAQIQAQTKKMEELEEEIEESQEEAEE